MFGLPRTIPSAGELAAATEVRVRPSPSAPSGHHRPVFPASRVVTTEQCARHQPAPPPQLGSVRQMSRPPRPAPPRPAPRWTRVPLLLCHMSSCSTAALQSRVMSVLSVLQYFDNIKQSDIDCPRHIEISKTFYA